jgi:hypothetical protein
MKIYLNRWEQPSIITAVVTLEDDKDVERAVRSLVPLTGEAGALIRQVRTITITLDFAEPPPPGPHEA